MRMVCSLCVPPCGPVAALVAAAGCVAEGRVVAGRRGSARMMEHAATDRLYDTVHAAEQLVGEGSASAAPSMADAALGQLQRGWEGAGAGGGEDVSCAGVRTRDERNQELLTQAVDVEALYDGAGGGAAGLAAASGGGEGWAAAPAAKRAKPEGARRPPARLPLESMPRARATPPVRSTQPKLYLDMQPTPCATDEKAIAEGGNEMWRAWRDLS